ncbi:MAG: hypothetical protein ACLU4N_10760 [Butyricimonas faecihominis]
MILILGDLNGRANTPAQKTLKTQDPESGTIKSENFYNTGYYLLGKNYGSYRYKGEWQTLDHIIVSGNLLNGKADLQAPRRMGIYDADFLLEEERGLSVFVETDLSGASLHWRIQRSSFGLHRFKEIIAVFKNKRLLLWQNS